jgi:Transposase IS116/IS110/IS902 family
MNNNNAPTGQPFDLESVHRLTRDLKQAAKTLTADEARYLTAQYYVMQGNRIRSANQIRQMEKSDEPHATLAWLAENADLLERNVKAALDVYSSASVTGRWSKHVKGIGPVISAGLLAHIDIARAPTAGHIWSFAGVNPNQKWEKGKKRPWNADLKRLLWIIGESFVKVSHYDDDIYGKVYLQRKAYEIVNNEEGRYADQAQAKLEKFKIGKDTDARKHYEAGRLPPAHIHARAKRYAVKLFLSAWHTVAYFERYGNLPPLPYPIVHLGHAHTVDVPYPELVPGLAEALRKAGR